MKAVLALIFFACVAGSMASDARSQLLGQLVEQGQAVAQTVLSQLQQQILNILQQAADQLSSLVGSLGRFDFNFNLLVNQMKPVLAGLINEVLVRILGAIQGVIGGM